MASAIRIFVDAHVFDGEFQGTRTFIKEIYTLIAQKSGLMLYLGANDADNLKKYFPEQDNIILVNYKSKSSAVRLLVEIPAIIRKHKIEYAHFQYILPPVKACRYIDTIHDVIFSDFPEEFSFAYRTFKSFLYRYSALRSDIITTVSSYSKESIRKHLAIRNREITVTPNGVAGIFFEPYDKQQSSAYISKKYGVEKYILYVSRIEPRKNHLLLLKAYLQLKLYEQGYHLVFLGHKTITVPALEEMIAGLTPEVRSFIFLNDKVDDGDLLQFYRASELFVYPSKAEGFGIPPLEAAALKVPVICANTSAMSDFSFFGKTHIDPYDFENFVNVLKETINNPPNDSALGNLSEIIRQRYTWSHSAEMLFESIINDKNLPLHANK